MNLREIILCAPLQQQFLPEEIIEAVRARIKSHPEEVNQQGLLGLTPCHLAVIGSHPKLLEILVLEGQGDLSLMSFSQHSALTLATSQSLQLLLSQLQQEATRRQICKQRHLHDLLRNHNQFKSSAEFEAAVRERVVSYSSEVNEKTYLGRNAIHWCAYYGHFDLIPMIEDLYPAAEMDLKDIYQLTATELITKQASSVLEVQSTRVLTCSRRNISFAQVEKKRENEQEKEVVATPRLAQFPRLKIVHPSTGESIEDEVVLAAELRELKISEKGKDPKELYLVPLLKSVNARRGDFLKNYLKEGYLLSEFEQFQQQSLLSYAFDEGLEETFSQLLTHGGRIRSDAHFNQQRVRLAELLRTENHRRMILVSQNNVLEKVNWIELKKIRIEIIKQSSQFNELLNLYGLAQSMQEQDFVTLSDDMLKAFAMVKLLPLPLVKELYYICSSSGSRIFEPDEIANRVAGLSALHKPFEMISGLIKLQPELGRAQKLILLYVLKELLTHNREFSNLDFRMLSSIALPALFKTREHKEFLEILRIILLLRWQASETRLDTYFYCESLIQHHVRIPGQTDFHYQFQLSKEGTSKRAVSIASALRAHSLMLFHNLDVKELTDLGWKTANKQHLAPSVCDIENHFNHLSNWVTCQLLAHSDIRQRARYLKLCIKVVNELVESDAPDYTSAMAIFSAINQASITRLAGTFALLDRKTKKTRDQLEGKLAPHKNYQLMRESIDRNTYAIPYIGLITTDLTFAFENQEANKASIVGKVVRHLLQKKYYLDMFHLSQTANVGAFIQKFNIVDHNELFNLSLALEPRPQQLESAIDFNSFKAALMVINRNGSNLKVVLHGVCLEDKGALEPLMAWLKEQYVQDKFDIRYFAEVATIAHSIVYPGVVYKFNESYYAHLIVPAPEMAVLFRRQQRRISMTKVADPDDDIKTADKLRHSKQ